MSDYMTEILIKAKTMYTAMNANIQKGDPKSDNMKGLTEVAGIISSLITTIESQKEEIERLNQLVSEGNFPIYRKGISK